MPDPSPIRLHRRALLGGALLAAPVLAPLSAPRADGAEITPGDGAVPPDIAFADAHERRRRLSDYASRPVVLNLWATWCGPCRAELPGLSDFAAAVATDGIAVIPIATDCRRAGTVRLFLDDQRVSDLPIFSDPDDDVLSTLGIHGIPTTLLLDRDHRRVLTVTGALDWSDPKATRAVRQLLSRPPAAATSSI